MVNEQRILSRLEASLEYSLRDFLLDAQVSGRSPRTISFYRDKLNPLVAFLKRYGDGMAAELDATRLREFFSELNKTHTPGGVHAYWRATRAFVRFLVREELLPSDPMVKLRPPRVDLEPLEPVDILVVMAMLACCGKKLSGLRDKAIILTLLDTGLRAGELVALNVGDVDLAAGVIQVRKSKSRKPRTVFVGRKARRALLAYLRARGEDAPGNPLWTASEGSRLGYSGVRLLLYRRARSAGMKPPSPHSFRRAFALSMLRSGVDVVSLSRMMGHGSLPVLVRYLRQDVGELGAIHSMHSPSDRLYSGSGAVDYRPERDARRSERNPRGAEH